ncbi:phosphatase PAP2 family protein [Rhodanobacter lindaniclasticus]|uniref:undecaprenyl-diphosphate phosphatase n=1 Tax=Rhodanobacter lindaniclasticus TaxID=75310 RepID=A0A4S3KDP5_9GAMM|nr:phosphatase PAP2 family protein [Rhodanobacter lindaniclasticus]THD06570.1 phosphoesterase PA-phosphatase [Rhodanobacter lindaniclasticus]
MNTPAEWIALHALKLWALLLLLALLAGDLAWQRNARWQRRAVQTGQAPTLLRWRVGLLLCLVLLLFFGGLALAISGQPTTGLGGFDTSLAASLRAHLPVPVLRMIAAITHLGDTLWVASAAAVVLLVLLLRHRWSLAASWSVALLGILPINGGLKALFRRVRPLHDHGFIVEPGWSFPSGHAFGAMVFYGMLAYVLLRLTPRFHRAIIAGAVLMIGVIGTSRILLQVHYFSDVLAGYATGAAWLVLCVGTAEWLRHQPGGATP